MSDGRMVTLFVVFGVLMIAFFLIQILRKDSRTIPSTILRNRSMCFACLFGLCVTAAMVVAVSESHLGASVRSLGRPTHSWICGLFAHSRHSHNQNRLLHALNDG